MSSTTSPQTRLLRLTKSFARNRSSNGRVRSNDEGVANFSNRFAIRPKLRDQSQARGYSTEPVHDVRHGGFRSLGMKKGDKVVVAMSGGVDSSLSLALLASPHLPSNIPPSLSSLFPFSLPVAHNASQPKPNNRQSPLIPYKDLDITAVYMRNWSPIESEREEQGSSELNCAWEKDWEDVKLVCKVFGVDVELIDLSQPYWLNVFEPSIEAWQAGQTPNPDVACNTHVKFGELANKVLGPEVEQSGDRTAMVGEKKSWLATGHYASTDRTSSDRTRLLRSSDRTKDQTYYLSSCRESQLSRALFPLANLQKSTDVRTLARSFKLPTAEREESMGVCFIGERKGKFGQFVSQYTTSDDRPGYLVSSSGTILGTHQGLWHYTIGQRARIPGMKEKYFVASKKIESNEIVVVPGADHPALSCTSLTVPLSAFNWVWKEHPPSTVESEQGLRAKCQVRHRMGDVPVIVRRRGTDIEVNFDSPEKGVAPGQVVAIWDETGEWCLGSGVIEKTTCLQ